MIYLNLDSVEGREWLEAHKPRRMTAAQKKRAEAHAMPRALAEAALSQIMLRDKEVHTGRDLGAKPNDAIPLGAFSHWNAPDLPADDAKPMDSGSKIRADYQQDEAVKCVTLWRAVLEQMAFDTLKMWGCSRDEQRRAVLFFESPADDWRESREFVCALADIEPHNITAAYQAGRLKALADGAIGRDRWISRQINAQATAEQPDLFYSMGVR